VIKSLAERGGTFADGTPITAASLQDFGQQASDRILRTVSSGVQTDSGIASSDVGASPQTTQPSSRAGGGLLEAPIRSKATFKTEEKAAEEKAKAEKAIKPTKRFIQQFGRSLEELKKFDPSIEEVGFSGFISRKTATVANFFDNLPETKALQIQIKPLANGMAREIEGGRVTDQDRQIYADSFANALVAPGPTNTRLLSLSLISILDKGGNENGSVTSQLKDLQETGADIFNNVIIQVLEDYPELASDIFGEGFEVQ
jgi:hypothetical protein